MGQLRFVVCVRPGANNDLQTRRIYRVLPDVSGARSNFIRVVDDSGEDYLYPSRASFFLSRSRLQFARLFALPWPPASDLLTRLGSLA